MSRPRIESLVGAEAVQAISYDLRTADPSAWYRKADDLLSIGRILTPTVQRWWAQVEAAQEPDLPADQPPFEQQWIVLMLFAFAIENLCKGAIVQRGRFEGLTADDTGRLPASLKNHDLLRLFADLGIECDSEETLLLRRLTRAAVWAGRYPTAANFRLAAVAPRPPFGDGKPLSNLRPADISQCEALVGRLRSHIGLQAVQAEARRPAP